jgi:hypothetical protein
VSLIAHIEDRWYRAIPGPDGTIVKTQTARHGTGHRWRVRYIGPDGRERSKSFGRKTEAEAFKDTTAADVRRGTYIDPAAGKITLRKFAGGWLATRTAAASTREASPAAAG